jgi:hypothetical protein
MWFLDRRCGPGIGLVMVPLRYFAVEKRGNVNEVIRT